MADQEVIKHTKKIYKLWNSKEHGFWYKVKEFVLEIMIIVFAVSLSIWLHGRSEHAHQAKEVKAFLLGIKQDLKNDITEMKEDRKTFIKSENAFLYISSLKKGQLADADSINTYGNVLFNETGLMPNDGRFEGFKSSGKIGTIENLKIQNELMNLYQENIPTLVIYTNHYSKQKVGFKEYYYQNLKRTSDKDTNSLSLFSTDVSYYKASDLARIDNIIRQYDKCIMNMTDIITEIDKEYND